MDNIDLFNRIVATLFKELYSNFPKPMYIRAADIRAKAEIAKDDWWEQTRGANLNPVGCAVEWLGQEGFIRYTSESAQTVFAGVILTSKGFAALNKSPESISDKPTVGDRLKELSVAATNQTVASLVRMALTYQFGMPA